MEFSTNATAATLRPKNMVQLYSQTTYLLAREDVLHLIFDVPDMAEAEHQFGETVAQWSPRHAAGPRWIIESRKWKAATRAELQQLIAGRPVCMLGKTCPKHRRA